MNDKGFIWIPPRNYFSRQEGHPPKKLQGNNRRIQYQSLGTHTMIALLLTLLLLFFILKPAVAYGILGLLFIYASFQLRRVRRLSSDYVDRQLSA
jgi:hypothetical protein